MANKQYKLTLSLSDGSKIDAGTILVPQGDRGETGSKGATFTPSVSEAGVLSWTNNGGLTNPTPVNIKGPKGDDAVITSADVAGWGFTKNAGTITGIKMNGVSKGTSGVVDLGTVLTSHQDISGLMPKSGGTFTGTVTFSKQINLGQGDANCLYLGTDGRLNGPENRTLFGLVSGATTFGHTAYALKFRGSGTRPTFNGNDLALKSDIPTIPTDYVKYTAQTLTDAQKSQVRSNIGAGTSNFSGNYNDLSNKPTIQKMYGHVGYLVQDDQAQECTAEIQVVWYSSESVSNWDDLSGIVANTTSYYPASGYIDFNPPTGGSVRGIVIGIGYLDYGNDMTFHYINTNTGEKATFSTQSGILLDEIIDI